MNWNFKLKSSENMHYIFSKPKNLKNHDFKFFASL
eukprot:UN05417